MSDAASPRDAPFDAALPDLLRDGPPGPGQPGRTADDWLRIVERAEAHGVAPLLYRRLRGAGQLEALGGPAAARLREAYHKSWAESLLHFRVLETVLLDLAAAGIRPILLKGAALALTAYSHPALRPMQDVDLWVDPVEFRPALERLLSLGCRPTHDEQFAGAYETVTHHVSLVCDEGVVVELHHQWLNLPARHAQRAPFAELAARARDVPLGEARAAVLSCEDQVLHLCAHISVHRPAVEKLLWYYDVDQVIRRAGPGPDWDAMLETAQRYAMALPLQQALPQTVSWLATPIPAEALARLAGAPVTDPERRRFGPEALGPHSRLGDGMQRLAGLGGPSARLRFLGRMLFPAPGYMRERYPDAAGAGLVVAYPARWAAVLREYLETRGRAG